MDEILAVNGLRFKLAVGVYHVSAYPINMKMKDLKRSRE